MDVGTGIYQGMIVWGIVGGFVVSLMTVLKNIGKSDLKKKVTALEKYATDNTTTVALISQSLKTMRCDIKDIKVMMQDKRKG